MLQLSSRLYSRWARMVQPAGSDECWPWHGRPDAKGYGFIKVYGTTTRVHRVAWAMEHGHWPPSGRVVRHACDNPPCVNPAHLVLGTVRDNVQDCIARGRRAAGERLRQSKLTEASVVAIRQRAAAGETSRAIASDFGMTPQAVTSVTRRRTWKHVA